MKKQLGVSSQFDGIKLFLNLTLLLTTFLFTFFLSCNATLAEQLDPRWKLYASGEKEAFYYDTQSMVYDSSNQLAKIWIRKLDLYGNKTATNLIFLSFKNKQFATTHYITYEGNRTYDSIPSRPIWYPVLPDLPSEKLANIAASHFNIKKMFKGGLNRWKLLHTFKDYTLWVATDTLIHLSKKEQYAICIKHVYSGGRYSEGFYTCDFINETVCPPHGSPKSLIPESEEEFVYNTIKRMIKAK